VRHPVFKSIAEKRFSSLLENSFVVGKVARYLPKYLLVTMLVSSDAGESCDAPEVFADHVFSVLVIA
jgi:hypothetical protein